MRKDDHPGKDFMLGAMIGSTLGALTAMMFSTKKGHRIQKDLADKYHEFEHLMKGYVQGKKRVVKEGMRKIAKQAKKKLQKVKKTLKK